MFYLSRVTAENQFSAHPSIAYIRAHRRHFVKVVGLIWSCYYVGQMKLQLKVIENELVAVSLESAFSS